MIRSRDPLVRRLAAYGQGLKAGDIVLSGSLSAPSRPRAVEANFGAFGRVSLGFA